MLTGDVLVYVNQKCVLGFTHQDVVNLFQSIPVGQKIQLRVCRGYLLPFDPDDPNTEIITTVAVTLPAPTSTTPTPSVSTSRLDSIQSVPPPRKQHQSMPNLVNHTSSDSSSQPAEILTANIVKGAMGFGFTIADSAYGQKVKQILDGPRCQTLQEGDVLVSINQTRVKDLSHTEVVDVLKACPKGQAAAITVQRGG